MRLLAVGVPLVVFGLYAGLFARRGRDWREVVLAASVLWGLTVLAITEGLSALGALSFPPMLAAWGAVAGAAFAVWLTRRLRQVRDPLSEPALAGESREVQGVRGRSERWTSTGWPPILMVAAIGIIGL